MLARLAAAKPCTSLGASVIRSIRTWTPEILHESMTHEKMNLGDPSTRMCIVYDFAFISLDRHRHSCFVCVKIH